MIHRHTGAQINKIFNVVMYTLQNTREIVSAQCICYTK